MVRKPYQVRDAVRGSSKSVCTCVHCERVATSEALFKVEGVTAIEKYCDACMEHKEFERPSRRDEYGS